MTEHDIKESELRERKVSPLPWAQWIRPPGDDVPLRDLLIKSDPVPRDYDNDFNDFFRKEYPRVVKVVMYAGATFEEAEDAVSPAMALAYTEWPLLTQPAAWVRTVALRLYFKKAKKDRARITKETAAARLDGVDRLSAGAHEEPDERSRVIAILRCLPPAQLAAMALSFDGYTTVEIAQMLHQNADTVRSNLRHARKRLRDDFENPAGGQAIVAEKAAGDRG